MSDIDLDAIRARAEAATPGPWYWRNSQQVYLFGVRSKVVMAFDRMGMQGAQPLFRDGRNILRDSRKANLYDYADAAFIAHARGDVDALLVEVERLRALLPEPATCARSHCVRDVDPTIDPDLCPPCREQADNLPSGGRS